MNQIDQKNIEMHITLAKFLKKISDIEDNMEAARISLSNFDFFDINLAFVLLVLRSGKYNKYEISKEAIEEIIEDDIDPIDTKDIFLLFPEDQNNLNYKK